METRLDDNYHPAEGESEAITVTKRGDWRASKRSKINDFVTGHQWALSSPILFGFFLSPRLLKQSLVFVACCIKDGDKTIECKNNIYKMFCIVLVEELGKRLNLGNKYQICEGTMEFSLIFIYRLYMVGPHSPSSSLHLSYVTEYSRSKPILISQ